MDKTIPSDERHRRGCQRAIVGVSLLVLLAAMAYPSVVLATGSCGDGIIDAGEGCDDTNELGGDGCSEDCLVEICFACVGEPSLCAPDDGASCDDGLFCNGEDTCSAGVCGDHAGDPCPGPNGDGNCSGSCDEATDSCTANDPDGSSCTDDLFCTGADTCNGGSCSVHAGDPCPGANGDGNCSESCSESTDDCTAPDPNGAACSDGVFCNGADTCSGGTCSVHPGDPCPGPDGDADCSEMCNESTDSCTAADPNGSACDDGLFCTGLDFCATGTCSAHTNDPCPGPNGDGDCSESCDESADSCTGADPNGAPCDDGLFCTGADVCVGGSCSDHPAPPCAGPDGDADCGESCDEATQTCTANDPNGSACNDGLFCTVDDSCDDGSCSGASRDCGAVGDQCRDGVCDENADLCVGPPKPEGTPCNDANSCTTPDTCDDAGNCVGLPNPGACLDDFTCYRAGATSGSERFVTQTNVTLTDQFRTSSVTLTKPRLLCSPTDNDGANPEAPTHSDHLEDYQLKPFFSFSGVGTRTISNQFGTIVLELQKPVALMAPTLTSASTPPGPPAASAVDHFQCYRVKVASGQPKFQRFEVPIRDEFGLRVVTVVKPRRLCAPVDPNDQVPGAEMHPKHLLCYQIKEFSFPKFVRVTSIFTHPPFGPETLDAKKPDELCVSSLRSP